MGKGGGSSTTTVKNEMSPEQRKIMQGEMNFYMPGGKFGQRPQFNPAEHSWMGENRIAKFNGDQNAAFDATRATAFEHRPAMEAATRMAVDGAGPTGQEQALGTGWSTDANGRAKFADFNGDTVRQFMSPYSDNVVGAGLEEMQRAHDIQQRRVNDAAGEASAFGGSRHGVQAAETTEGFARQARGFLADTLDRGYTRAVDQYNTERNEGQEQLGWNKTVQDANAKRMSDASDRVAALAKTNQELNGAGVNALANIGDMQQERAQQVLDTSANELQNNYLWQAQLGQMLSGFAPAPTTTQTTSQRSGGSIWGTVGSAALSGLSKAAFAGLSDENSKENIERADPNDALDEIRKVAKRGLYTYDYNEEAKDMGAPDGRRTGFMAQDLEAATGQENPKIGEYQGIDLGEHLGRLTHAVVALDEKIRSMSKSEDKEAA